jgi:hypothetical protein
VSPAVSAHVLRPGDWDNYDGGEHQIVALAPLPPKPASSVNLSRTASEVERKDVTSMAADFRLLPQDSRLDASALLWVVMGKCSKMTGELQGPGQVNLVLRAV